MKPLNLSSPVTQIYDRALRHTHSRNLPPDAVWPRPTAEWPPENCALLERYRDWLVSGGASPNTVRILYLPMAGHILGLNLKPHHKLNLTTDLQKGLDFVLSKQISAMWTKLNRNAMEKFRRFLMHERGLVEIKVKTFDPSDVVKGLPEWLVTELTHLQHIQQTRWRTARLQESIRRFWAGHTGIWHFLFGQCAVTCLEDIRRKHLMAYIDQGLSAGLSISTVNNQMRNFHAFMVFLQEQEYAVPHILLRMATLKEPDDLPKFLTDEQVQALRDVFEVQVQNAASPNQRRDALLDRACFYLLWQGGLRKGEVEDLTLEELDLAGKRLMVRRGKGLTDRTVYLTETTVQALREYLTVRGMGPTSHVFLYRNQQISKDLIHGRLKAAGEKVGVAVSAHRLRHTCATQLLNAGCRITSIQKILGHRRIDTTLIYARVHDQTVSSDYYTAMSSVEKRLELMGEPEEPEESVPEGEKARILALAACLAEPELSYATRMTLVGQIRQVLGGEEMDVKNTGERLPWDDPPEIIC